MSKVKVRKNEVVLNSTNLDDASHPFWLRRKQLEEGRELGKDEMPDQSQIPVFSRAEICELLQVSDSAFGKWDVESCGKSGKYTLYRLSDVLWLRMGDQFRNRNHHLDLNRKQAAGMVHQMMAHLGER